MVCDVYMRLRVYLASFPCQWLHAFLDSGGRSISRVRVVLILRLLPSTSFVVYIVVFTHPTISSFISYFLPNMPLNLTTSHQGRNLFTIWHANNPLTDRTILLLVPVALLQQEHRTRRLLDK